MRRAGRIIYNGGMVVSLLLCLGTVGVWVRSYWVSDSLTSHTNTPKRSDVHYRLVKCSRGGVQFYAWDRVDMAGPSKEETEIGYERNDALGYPVYEVNRERMFPVDYNRYAGFGFDIVLQAKKSFIEDGHQVAVERSLTLPLYFPALLFALLPAHYFLRVRRRRRIANRSAQGCCIFCGYDLRASPARCPECGREPNLTGHPKSQTQAPAPPPQ